MIVVVLGMHRSGTSLVSSLLHNVFGITMIPDMSYNNFDDTQPHGYWEDARFKAINNDLLRMAGGTWRNPPTPIRIRQAAKSKDAAELRSKMSKLLKQRDTEAQDWGWKDPRTCLTFYAWERLIRIREVKLVATYRNHESIVDSLMRRADKTNRDKISREKWAAVARHYDEQVNLTLQQLPYASVQLDFDRLTKSELYTNELRKLTRLIGGELTTQRRIEATNLIRFR